MKKFNILIYWVYSGQLERHAEISNKPSFKQQNPKLRDSARDWPHEGKIIKVENEVRKRI